jgi:hypothetical protein
MIFEIGAHMDQVSQALIDRSRVLLDLKTVKNDSGLQASPGYREKEVSRMGSRARASHRSHCS